jgi:small-conductance mechanosensitive channel
LTVTTPTPTPARTSGIVDDVTTTSSDALGWLFGAPLRVTLIVVGALVLRWLAHRAITGFVTRTVESSLHDRLAERRGTRVLVAAGGPLLTDRRRQRAETLGSVLRSMASIAIFAVASTTVLGEFGIELGPLIASAGIVGVALGFGAQTLVKDFLSGIFLILEDQYGVGDVIDAGPAVGMVEEVRLRVTRIRDADGMVWYVRNGEILRVGNRSQGWSTAVVDIPVAASEDLSRVQELIAATVAGVLAEPEWHERVLDAPGAATVSTASGDAVTLRLVVRTHVDEHGPVQVELQRRLAEAFVREGIAVPA